MVHAWPAPTMCACSWLNRGAALSGVGVPSTSVLQKSKVIARSRTQEL
jgi:hypothetical protein